MLTPRVFISFNHNPPDRKVLEELRVRLKPYEDRGEIVLWFDEKLRTSEDWDLRIIDAISQSHVVVFLVSSRFFVSDYIRDKEVPHVLAARARGEVDVASLYIDHANAVDLTFNVLGADGFPTSVSLTAYQGLNSPIKPLIDLRSKDRNKALAVAVKEVVAMAKSRIYHRTGRTNQNQPEGDRLELQIELRAEASGLRRSVACNGITRPFGGVEIADSERLVLDWQSSSKEMGPKAISLGSPLRRILLGEPSQALNLFRAFDSRWNGHFDLRRRPVRVRIRCESERIRALPWTLVANDGERLTECGWSFELIGDSRGEGNVRLRAPFGIVAFLGGSSDSEDLTSYASAIKECARKHWPSEHANRPVVVRDLDEFVEEVRTRRPRLILLDGLVRAEPSGSPTRLVLMDRGGDAVRVDDVAAAIRDFGLSPEVVLIRGVGDASSLDLTTPFENTSIAFVGAVWSPEKSPSESRGEILRRLDTLLKSSRDSDAVQIFQAGASARVQCRGRYRDWFQDCDVPRRVREGLAGLGLDREDQRGRVRRVFDALLSDEGRRVACCLGFGTHGNLVDTFSKQIKWYLETYGGDVGVLQAVTVAFPPDLPDLNRGDFQRAVLEALGGDSTEPLSAVLERTAIRVPARQRAVVYFDWGTRGARLGQTLTPASLEHWLEFCASGLARECPSRIRIVSMLAAEIRPESRAAIEEDLERLEHDQRFRSREFFFQPLPPLGEVKEIDLANCPKELFGVLPGLVIAETGGVFERVVEIIEDVVSSNDWFGLSNRLQKTHGDVVRRRSSTRSSTQGGY
jgi:hypothetical protein